MNKVKLLEQVTDLLGAIPFLRLEEDKEKIAKIEKLYSSLLEMQEFKSLLEAKCKKEVLSINNKFDNINQYKVENNSENSSENFIASLDYLIFQKGNNYHKKLTVYRRLFARVMEYYTVFPIFISKDLISSIRQSLTLIQTLDTISIAVAFDIKSSVEDYVLIVNKQMFVINKQQNKEIFKSSVNKLNDLLRVLHYNKQRIDDNTKVEVSKYFNKWRADYCKLALESFPNTVESLRYYNGAIVEVFFSRYHPEGEKFLSGIDGLNLPDLVMHYGKKNSNGGTTLINFDENIYDLFVPEEVFTQDTSSTAMVGFRVEELKVEDHIQRKKLTTELKKEVLSLYMSSSEKRSLKYVFDVVLSNLGFFIRRVVNENYLLATENQMYHDFLTNEEIIFKKLEFESEVKLKPEEIIDKYGADSHCIILCYFVLSSLNREKFKKFKKYKVLDVSDVFKRLDEPVASNYLLDGLIRDYIYPSIVENNGITSMSNSAYFKEGERLIDHLNRIPLGKAGWKDYEYFSIDVLKYILSGSFDKWNLKEQVTNSVKTDRKDFLLRNNSTKPFWKKIGKVYGANNIVVECKNYNKPIGNNEFRQVFDYLDNQIHGNFGLILTRQGLASKGKLKQVEYLKGINPKLILVLSDEDVINLITKKMYNEDPDDILDTFLFDLEAQV